MQGTTTNLLYNETGFSVNHLFCPYKILKIKEKEDVHTCFIKKEMTVN